MAVWGVGNMDSDGALDVLVSWFELIIKDIRETFKLEHQKTLYEDRGESNIIANIDILITLITTYGAHPSLTLEEIDGWTNDYLDTFNRTIEIYDPQPGFVTWRREYIVKTFDRLHNEMELANMP